MYFFTERHAKSTANHLSKIPAKSETPTPIIEKVMNYYQYLIKKNLVVQDQSLFKSASARESRDFLLIFRFLVKFEHYTTCIVFET